MSVAPPELSVLLPAFNEAESLPQLWSELGPVLDALGRATEVIIVDDGSTDATPAVARTLHARDARVHLLRLVGNGGLSAALDAGFARARGRIVFTWTAIANIARLPRFARTGRLRRGEDGASGGRSLLRSSHRASQPVRTRSPGDGTTARAPGRDGTLPRGPAALPRLPLFVPTLWRMAGCRVRSCR